MIRSNPVFKPLYTTKKRYIIITGGRGGAKSFEVNTFLTLLTYEAFQRILFTRWTMKSAEISIIPEFTSKADLLEVPHDFKTNKTNVINLTTGNYILFRGVKTSSGNQTANLKSLPDISTWAQEEGEEFVSEDNFDTIDLSIRTKRAQNRVIWVMNPSDKDHFIYRRFFQNTCKIVNYDGIPVEISTHPDVCHIHTTYLDALEHLSDSVIKNMRRAKVEAPLTYAHKIIGQWSDSAEGSLYSKINLKYFRQGDLITAEYQGGLAYIDVADEGTDYLCMVVGKLIGNKLFIIDVVYTQKDSEHTWPVCAEMLNRYQIPYCRVESNNMGGVFANGLKPLLKATNIEKISSSDNKHTRIVMEAVFVREYFMFLEESKRSAMYQEYINHLCLYRKDKKENTENKERPIHDDAPDATSGLAIMLRTRFKSLYF